MKRPYAAIILVALAGCSSADWARNTPGRLFSNYKVTLYSGGKAVGIWYTKGQVESETKSDGYYFVDRSNGKIVEVSGTILIEQD